MLHYWLRDQVRAVAGRCGVHVVGDDSIFLGCVTIPLDLLPTENLEVDQVQVHRVGVAGHVPDLPFLGGAQGRVLRGGTVPGDCTLHLADQAGVHIFRRVWPVDGISCIVGSWFCCAQ